MVRINVLTRDEGYEVVFTGKPIGYRYITDAIHPLYLVAAIPWDVASIKDDQWHIVPGSESLSLAEAACTAVRQFNGCKHPRAAAVAVLCVTHTDISDRGDHQAAGTVIELCAADFYPQTIDGLPVLTGCEQLSDAMRQYTGNMLAVQKDMGRPAVTIHVPTPADPTADTAVIPPELGGES